METTTAYNHVFVSPIKKLKCCLELFGTEQSIYQLEKCSMEQSMRLIAGILVAFNPLS